MASTWGENIKLSIFGGSHTEAIGVVLDNLPPNEKIDKIGRASCRERV